MNIINEIIEEQWNNCSLRTIYEGEGYYENVVEQRDFENAMLMGIKAALDAYEEKLSDRVGEIDLDRLMDNCRRELEM